VKPRREIRSARPHRYVIPTRGEVRQRLLELSSGQVSREDMEDWAAEYVVYDDSQIYPDIDDPPVWDAILALAGCATLLGPNDYLYGPEDFRAWAELL
jgi:hypothetical protein